jgi:hypothetical protein
MQVVETNLKSDDTKNIADNILSNIFTKNDLDVYTLSSEYRILLMNSKCKLKNYFVKNVCENEKIIDIETHCYKFASYDTSKKDFIISMANLENSYASYYLIITFDKIIHFGFIFILKKDLNYNELNDTIKLVSSNLNKAQSGLESDISLISTKIKSTNDDFSTFQDAVQKKLTTIISQLTILNDDVADLNSKIFPSGKERILM